MRLLILGGTDFVGRAVAVEALARGAEVTVLHRGRTPAPEKVTELLGDRTDGTAAAALAAAGGTWDAVVDTWTGAPRAVLEAARLLRGRAGRYAYVSSRSVYADAAVGVLDEDCPVVEAAADDGPVDYARAKRGGELAAIEVFGDRALLLRAGLILGPRENVGRLPWWLRRIARGGPVPAPGPRDLPLQYIDARDLAVFTLDALAGGLGGAYNAVGPGGHATMGELLDACVAATGSGAELRWVGPEQVGAAGAAGWTELPVWLPPGELHAIMHGGDVTKALDAGLRCRPVGETVADTWAWLTTLGDSVPQYPGRPPVGLPPEKDAALLAAADGN